MKRTTAATVFVGLLSAAPVSAQRLSDALHGYAGGAALDVAARGPWVAEGWRKPIPRVFLTTAGSVAFAVASRSPTRWRDFGRRTLGSVVAELVLDDVVLILRKGEH